MKSFINKTLLIATVFSSTMIFQAHAALPPFYESLKEYKALLNSTELTAQLGSADMIQNIERGDKGFVITTPHHILRVDVEYEHNGNAGPATFQLIFHEAEDLH